MSRLTYRPRQVWERYRGAPLETEAREWIAEWLSPAQHALFYAQERVDQRHAYTVARALAAQGHRKPHLLQAALLHDCGKAPGVSLFFRTLYVLLNKARPEWLAALSPQRADWLAPLARAVHHPALGAALAAQAGSDPHVVRLIAQHQAERAELPADLLPLHHALKAVDERT